ncbi:MAG TPA: winged helix-turn-helix domain-containing protein [Thermoanaerobaculia bacterium]|nr:winged helix-turn-helix domain-containing protein [Thermoanaerobaculia bacterium]
MVRFGVFELDAAQGELRRDGVKVRLQDQPLRLLQVLVERPGEVVTREELRERLWPSDFVDFDHGLNTAVRKLRAALDDTAEKPRYIETLARRGYRLIAPVTLTGDSGPPRDARGASPGAIRRVPILLIASVAIVVLAIAAALWLRQRGQTAARSAITAVAVLPFANDDAATEHISDGLSEILIDKLSLTPELRVTARTSVFRYKNQDIDPWRVGKDLSVGALVMGRVQRDGDRYTIRVELIDVRNATQMWGRRFEAKASELSAVQGRISEDLSRALRQRIGAEQKRLIGRAYTSDAEAYDLYLQGLYAWNCRTKDDIRKAVDLFRQAIDRDPSFAAAHAGLANTYGIMVGNGLLTPDLGTPMVLAAARKTLELDPSNAEAYTSIATTQFRNLWDFEAAERNYRRSLELNPNYATGRYGDYLRSMGRFEEARREVDLAYALDPLSSAITGAKCGTLLSERKYRQAVAFSQRVASVDARLRPSMCERTALVALGEYEAVMKDLEATGEPDPLALVAAYRQGGMEGFLRKRLEMFLTRQSDSFSSPVQIAEVYALLGDEEEMFAWLEKGYDGRASQMTNINTHHAFDRVRDHPRFVELLRRIGIPQVSFPASSPASWWPVTEATREPLRKLCVLCDSVV